MTRCHGFPGRPTPEPNPRQEENTSRRRMDSAGGPPIGDYFLVDGGAILFSSVVSSCVRRSRSFSPSTVIHAESPLPCITVAGLSPGILPVGAGLCPPTWVAGVTPAPRWSRSPPTKPHAPNPSPQPSPYKVMWGREPIRLSRGVFLASSQ